MTTPIDYQRPRRILYAIGTRTYRDQRYQEPAEEYAKLQESIPTSLDTVIGILTKNGVENKLRKLDPTTRELKKIFQEAAQSAAGDDNVIIYYTGHGETLHNQHHLITTDFIPGQEDTVGITVADVPKMLIKHSPAEASDPDAPYPPQPAILLILDCCYAGTGGKEIRAQEVLANNFPNPRLYVWATTGATHEAISGVFANNLKDIFETIAAGTRDDLPFYDVLNLMHDKLEGGKQATAALFPPASQPDVPPFFPNPGYLPGAAGRTVAEQRDIRAARESSHTASVTATTGVGYYLTGRKGRHDAAANLARWITNPAAGDLAVLTGSPGTGKSALLALPVLLGDPTSRQHVLGGTPAGSLAHQIADLLPDTTTPAATAVRSIRARDLNTDQIAGRIADCLGRPATPGATFQELLESLNTEPTDPHSPVIILDGLDEANAPERVRDNLLLPLTKLGVRIAIGTRAHLKKPLAHADLFIDLDSATYRDPDALTDYTTQLLKAANEPNVHSPYHDSDDTVIGTIATEIARRATSKIADTEIAESFLIAEVITRAVRARPDPINTTTPDWATALPTDTTEAFNEDLTRLDHDVPGGRVLLEALAWARGPGLPGATLWLPVARALAAHHRNHNPAVPDPASISSDTIADLLVDHAGAFIIEANGLFRPFHDRLAEHLRTLAAPTDSDIPAVQTAITTALLATLGVPPRWDHAHPYLRTYLCQHAHTAGTEAFTQLLDDPGYLATANPATLTPLLGSAVTPQRAIVRGYRRARSLLGDNPADNAAYLQEAVLAVGGQRLDFSGSGIEPAYTTILASVISDGSYASLTRHETPFTAITFGKTKTGQTVLVAASSSGEVLTWNPDSGERRPSNPNIGITPGVLDLAYGTSTAGRTLIVAVTDDATVRLWDIDQPSEPPVIRAIPDGVGRFRSAVCITCDGQVLLATLSDSTHDNNLQVIDVQTGKLVGTPQTVPGAADCLSLRFTVDADGRTWLVIVDLEQKYLEFRDPKTGSPIGNRWNVPDSAVHNSAVHMALVHMARGTNRQSRILLALFHFLDKSIRVFDLANGQELCPPLPLCTYAVKVTFGTTTSGRRLLAGTDGDTIRVWDLDDLPKADELILPPVVNTRAIALMNRATGQAVLAAAGVTDGLSQTGDRTTRVHLWGFEQALPVGTLIPAGPPKSLRNETCRIMMLPQAVAMATSDSSDLMVALTADWGLFTPSDPPGELWLWRLDGAHADFTKVSEAMFGFDSVAINTSTPGAGAWLAATERGCARLWLWQLASDGTLISGVALPNEDFPRRDESDLTAKALSTFALASTGELVIATTARGSSTIWITDLSRRVTEAHPLPSGRVALAVGTDREKRLLVLSAEAPHPTEQNPTMQLWQPDSATFEGKPLPFSAAEVRHVAFGSSLNGKTLLAIGRLKQKPTPLGHDAALFRIWDHYYAYPGTQLVQIWETETGTCLSTIQRRTNVYSLALNGNQLAIGEDEGVVLIAIPTDRV